MCKKQQRDSILEAGKQVMLLLWRSRLLDCEQSGRETCSGEGGGGGRGGVGCYWGWSAATVGMNITIGDREKKMINWKHKQKSAMDGNEVRAALLYFKCS